MPTRTPSNAPARPASPATSRRTGRYVALVALGLAAAACSGRDRARTTAVDADLGHDLDLASTTGIELANRGRAGTQVVSAIEETPRAAPRRSSARKPTSAGNRRQKVAKKQEPKAPPATVMVADHEVMAAASTENAGGSDATSSAPSEDGPNAGPAIIPEPVPYPAGGGDVGGRGQGGGGGGIIGAIGGVILRGGMGGVDRCDERHGHGGRRGGGIGGGIGGVIISMPGRTNPTWPRTAGTFPRY